MLQAKEFSFTLTFIINTNFKSWSKKIMQTIKSNYVSVRIGQILVKYGLDLIKTENGNQYLTNI